MLTRRELLALSAGMGTAALSPKIARAAEAPPVKAAPRWWQPPGTPLGPLRINNPYEALAGRWLKGETHCHVDCGVSTDGKGRTQKFGDGATAEDIYAAAVEAGLDFVCMSVDVLDAKGGIDVFGDTGRPPANIIGIPAQEIQSNWYYDGESDSQGEGDSFFSEDGARYLHVLTLGGPGGLSLCAHPLYHELANPRAGGCWNDIKEALLRPDPGGDLAGLNVRGLEIYNGFTLRKAEADAENVENAEAYRECFDEECWDDLLEQEMLCWGFAGNDTFYKPERDDFDSFCPLGLVHVSVPQGAGADDVLAGLSAGRFYSSTGVELAAEPLKAVVHGDTLRIEVSARSAVDWCARIYECVNGTWRRTHAKVENSSSAVFKVNGDDWKYVRISCRSRSHWLQRAWLQPITNQRYFPPRWTPTPTFRATSRGT